MKRIRYAFVLTLAALLALLSAGTSAAADYTHPEQRTVNGITAYYTTIYSKFTCRNTTAKKFQSVTFRYKRANTLHKALIKKFDMTQHLSKTCAGTTVSPGQYVREVENKWACFGCRSTSKLWSDNYRFSVSWPALVSADWVYQGSYLKTTARRYYSSGELAKSTTFCMAFALQGGDYC